MPLFFKFLDRKTVTSGQMIATFRRNILRHCWAQHVARIWSPCCDMLGVVSPSFPKNLSNFSWNIFGYCTRASLTSNTQQQQQGGHWAQQYLRFKKTKSMCALWLVNQLWVIVTINPRKNRASSELLYKSNRPQVSMVYKLINHLGMLVEHSKNS